MASGNVKLFAKNIYRRRQLSEGCRLFTGARQASGKANLTVVMLLYSLCLEM